MLKRSAQIYLKISPEEKEEMENQAKKRSISLSGYIRMLSRIDGDNLKLEEKISKYERTGKTPEQVSEWVELEKNGRILILPCKFGTLVYYVQFDISNDCLYIEEVAFDIDMIALYGNLVFSTRKEAELLIESMKGNKKSHVIKFK